VFATGAIALGYLFYKQLMAGSLVVSGTRYFVLDDDMMVSMRYGRNLAEGHGLVWNPGERIEGYTNFLWTLVMAVVHLLPFSDAQAAVPVKLVSFGLVAASLWLALRLLRVFAPGSRLAAALVVFGIVTCVDVVHWAAWGFETSLLGFLELVFLVCLLEGRRMTVGWVALALIPLVRSDAVHVFAADALLAMLLSDAGRKTAGRLALALIPFALHLAFRHIYYGDWLPNTYYLKLDLLDDRYGRGANYLASFTTKYLPILILALVGTITSLRTDRRALAGPVVIGASLAYVVTTGGDMFFNFRFLAHVMPVLFVFAAIGVVKVARSELAIACAAVVFLVVCIAPWRPLSTLVTPDNNGEPGDQIHTAVLIKQSARPDSSVAVFAAGIVPYFTHLEAIDILGKSDRHVARLRPFPGAEMGHGKLDPAYTLSSEPDLVVSNRSLWFVQSLTVGTRTADPVLSFLSSPPFQQAYLPYPVVEPFLLGRTALYTRPGSSEYADRRWESVDVRP
jgi:arabinofuranosyltransferase